MENEHRFWAWVEHIIPSHAFYHISKEFQVTHYLSPNILGLMIDGDVCNGAGTSVQQGIGWEPKFCSFPKASSFLTIFLPV